VRRLRRARAEDAPVLLLGNYRATIALARALGAAGYAVTVGRGGGEGGAEVSRFVGGVWEHPPLGTDPDAFLDALGAFLGERSHVGVVFPVTDEFVRVVSAHRDRLPDDRIYVLPARDAVAATVDKIAAYDLARAAGVAVAPWAVVERADELDACCARLGYPVVLRPVDATRRLQGAKAIIVRSPEALRRAVPVWPVGQPGLLVQQEIVGRRHNVYFAARAGRIVRIVEAVIDRTDEPDGTGLAVAGRTVPSTAALERDTAALAARLDYTGVGCAQYLVDGDTTSFLELNPRVGGNHAVPEAAGLDLGAVAIALATPGSADVPFRAGRPGLVYAWTYGDLRGFWAAFRRGQLSRRRAIRWAREIVATFLVADVHMTWRWDDPMPAVLLYARSVPGLRRLGRRPRVGPMPVEPGPVAS
jgi:predicted ATP-grasp superfamily ATP-dependent carboligase